MLISHLVERRSSMEEEIRKKAIYKYRVEKEAPKNI
jgi:hypothetical protein